MELQYIVSAIFIIVMALSFSPFIWKLLFPGSQNAILIRLNYIKPRSTMLLVAFAMIIQGFFIFREPSSVQRFVGTLFTAFGIQIGLWALGIRLEILGNVSSDPEELTGILPPVDNSRNPDNT